MSFYAFEVLYWCGVREGELLALTPADFDFEKRTVTINKSYQRLNKQDVITTPKTPKSNRVIQMPQFLCDELQDYLKQLYGVEPDSRMFPISKSYLHREMDRGCKQTGVKRIRLHDLRHSHISLLIDMGFTALAIAERVGHESIDITYRYAHLFPTRQVEMEDGSMLSIDGVAVANEVANSMYQRSELDWLIYNDPLAYAELILDGDIANYLKSVSYVNDRS